MAQILKCVSEIETMCISNQTRTFVNHKFLITFKTIYFIRHRGAFRFSHATKQRGNFRGGLLKFVERDDNVWEDREVVM